MLLFRSIKTTLARIQFVVRATDKINDICTKSVKIIIRKNCVQRISPKQNLNCALGLPLPLRY